MSCACWRVFLSQLPGAKRRQKTGFRALLARPRHTPPTPPQRCPHTNRDTFSLQMSNKSELAQQRVRRFNRVFSALGGAALSIACSARLHAALSAPSSPFHNAAANNMRRHRHPPPLPPSQGLLHKEHNNIQRREDEQQRRHSGRHFIPRQRLPCAQGHAHNISQESLFLRGRVRSVLAGSDGGTLLAP